MSSMNSQNVESSRLDGEKRAGRKPRADGVESRRAILHAAANLATTHGLEGLSIGELAQHIGMSKSGLYAHFKAKEELELATIETRAARSCLGLGERAARDAFAGRLPCRANRGLLFVEDADDLADLLRFGAREEPAAGPGAQPDKTRR